MRRKNTKLALIGGLVAVAALLTILFVDLTRGVRVYVVLPQLDGLNDGDKVTWNENEIGKVVKTEAYAGKALVTLRLKRSSAEAIPSDITFKVHSPGFLSTSKEHRLEPHVLDAGSNPITESATITGVGSLTEP